MLVLHRQDTSTGRTSHNQDRLTPKADYCHLDPASHGILNDLVASDRFLALDTDF